MSGSPDELPADPTPSAVDPLTLVLAGWFNTSSWAESEAFLAGHPELATDAGEKALAEQLNAQTDRNALVLVEEHAMLLRRVRERGIEETFPWWAALRQQMTDTVARAEAAQDRYVGGAGEVAAVALDETVEVRAQLRELAAGIPTRRQSALVDEAKALVERYRVAGRDEDLDAALHRAGAALRPPMTCPPGWAELILGLTVLLRQRHERSRDAADLDAAVDLVLKALRAAAPDSTAVPMLLGALGEAIRARHSVGGRPQDLELAIRSTQQAIDALEQTLARLPFLLDNLGGALAERYQIQGDDADLDRSVSAFTDAVRHLPTDAPARPGSLANLAGVLLLRHDRRSEPADLERATDLLTEATALVTSGSRLEAAVHGTLANAWRRRYERGGDPAALDHAVASGEHAVRAAGMGTADRPSHLVALGQVLQARAERGAPDDIDRAVTLYREAVAETPADFARLRDRVNSLGIGLLARYQLRGTEKDLDEALELLEHGSGEDAPASVSVLGLLFNRGNGQWIRYRRTGDLAALDRAVVLFTRVAEATPADSVDRALCLNSLAIGLAERYERTGDETALRDCAGRLREALEIAPADSPARVSYAGNLGNALRMLYRHTGEPGLLDEAIQLLETALGLPSESADLRATLLNNLGSALVRRSAVPDRRQDRRPDGDPAGQGARYDASADLRAAEDHFRTALSLVAETSPARPLHLANLGRSLRGRHRLTGEESCVEEGVALLEEACRLALRTGPETALGAAQMWGRWAEARQAPVEAGTAYDLGVTAAHQLFQAQVLRSHRWSWLRTAADIHVRAAWNHVALSTPQGRAAAVVVLERGRALMLSEALEARSTMVDRLGEAGHQDLADRYRAAVARLGELTRGALEE
jgi:tetratricopeptide (TPR) repeat protein